MTESTEEYEHQANGDDNLHAPGSEYLAKSRSRPREKIWKDEDDDTNQYFMSEPSLSEDEHSHLRMAGLLPQESLSGDDDDDDDELDFTMPTPQPATSLNSHAHTASSPGGNTSLSSWDSPHLGKKISMYFSSTETKRTRRLVETTTTGQVPPVRLTHQTGQAVDQPDQSAFNQVKALPERIERTYDSLGPSSRSTSSVSLGQEQRAVEFLNELKLKSIGALQDAGTDDFDSDRNMGHVEQGQLNVVLRSRVARHQLVPIPRPRQIKDANADMSLNMTLSPSDGEDTEPLDWEEHHSADDEQIAVRPRRQRKIKAGKVPPFLHRRTRSGDNAAAALMTGGTDWRGMQSNQVLVSARLPTRDDNDDEHDQEGLTADDVQTSQARANTAIGTGGIWFRMPQNERSNKHDTDGFAVGSFGNSQKQRKGKKPPRNRRAVLQSDLPDWGNSSMSSTGGAHPASPGRQSMVSSNPGSGFVSDGRWNRHPIEDESTLTFQGLGMRRDSSWSPYDGSQSTFRPPLQFSSYDAYMDHPPNIHGQRERHTRSSSSGGAPSHVSELQKDFNRLNGAQSEASRSSREAVSWISRIFDPKSINNPREQEQQQPHPLASTSGNIPEQNNYPSSLGNDYFYADTEPSHMSLNEINVPGVDLHAAEMMFENKAYHGMAPRIVRPHNMNTTNNSPFNLLKRSHLNNFTSRAAFKPITNIVTDENTKNHSTFVCPRCGTRQREFFTVASAGNQFQSPAGYLAVYFTLYVMASLYIFGLDEGWSSLDCVYFAVITLTTAGLGDKVPTTDASKIICSIFIYFGVASIGLLLGSYLAGMMDEKSFKQAQENRLNNCVACSQVNTLKNLERSRKAIIGSSREATPRSATLPSSGMFHSERLHVSRGYKNEFAKEIAALSRPKRVKVQHSSTHSSSATSSSHISSFMNFQPSQSSPFPGVGNYSSLSSNRDKDITPNVVAEQIEVDDTQRFGNISGVNLGFDNSNLRGIGTPVPLSPIATAETTSPWSNPLGSPMTSQILDRQSHTRHQSFDVGRSVHTKGHFTRMDSGSSARPRKFSEDIASNLPSTIREDRQESGAQIGTTWMESDNSETDDGEASHTSEASTSSDTSDLMRPPSKIKTAKYVFLTLREALMNSILIIAIGSAGFFYIEKMSLVDSFYFTTVLLTTVGYGDIYPVTSAGKLFATIYVLVAGTVLLNNMSLISMIPLELRKRRLERAVLTQFGTQLDDAALRELATGPLVKRLRVSMQRPDGLDECTREMFALAMLVRLGKVTERDVRQTFSAFRRLDVDNDGVLNSRTIIAGMMQKRRSRINLSAMTDTDIDESLCQPQHVPSTPLSGYVVPTHPPFIVTNGETIENFWLSRGSSYVANQPSDFSGNSKVEQPEMQVNPEQASLLSNSMTHGSYTNPMMYHHNRRNDEEIGLMNR